MRKWLVLLVTLVLLFSLNVTSAAPVADNGAGRSDSPASTGSVASSRHEKILLRYAEDTWDSFVAMTDEKSGLPADRLHIDGTRSVETSTTNIGAYMWSALVAEELGFIDHEELVSRLSKTLSTLEKMERHEESGQFYNWYDHRTGEKLTEWPSTGDPLTPILSSVDNGWLATGLHLVRQSVPELSHRAGALFDSMDFSIFYNPDNNRLLFSYVPSTGEKRCCYDTLGEIRIASYIGMAKGEMPQKHYFGAWRTFPDGCKDWGWQEMRPQGFHRQYFGVDVFEGAYRYNGSRIVPNWGGSMFEALMVPLFVPEEEWAPGSWRVNHPLYVRAQIYHGMVEAGYGYWGFSPSDVPEGGYSVYGVDALGMNPDGYPSNNDNTFVDFGYEGCEGREPKPLSKPEEYTNGVVTPHAAFLALRWAPEETVKNLTRLERDFDIYTKWGFRDSVNVETGEVSDFYLALDQGMIMASIGNYLADDMLRRSFVTPQFEKRLRPPMAVEEFNVHPRACTVEGTPGDDVIHGTPGDDVICGLGGDDVIYGGGGDDVIYGDDGADRIYGMNGDDVLYGGDGEDQLFGGGGEDVLSAGPGRDVLTGDAGEDHFEGGAGSNKCRDVSAEDSANACGSTGHPKRLNPAKGGSRTP